MENKEDFTLRVLARPSEKNKMILEPYQKDLEIIWGDLKDDDKLRECVKGADYVLHVGAFLSPFADEHSEEAMRINYGSTLSAGQCGKRRVCNHQPPALQQLPGVVQCGGFGKSDAQCLSGPRTGKVLETGI